MLKKIINFLKSKEKENINVSYDPFSKIEVSSQKIIDLEALANISQTIPGMITPKSGQFLYTLCYMQEQEGDVVEIGSWQGRSTSFLARAVKESHNGNFYAIDHFKGNPGKKDFYVIDKQNLSDLKNNFISNIEKVGLSKTVKILDMNNEEASKKINESSVRFLFIDGDHSREGVDKDIRLFLPKLVPKGIIVFDDFSKSFPGVISAANELIKTHNISKIFSYKNTLVIKL